MRLSLCIVVSIVCLFVSLSSTSARTPRPDSAPAVTQGTLPRISDGSGLLLSSSTHAALLRRESAGPDTFDLYGGPRRVIRDPDGVFASGDEYVEGKFEDPSGRQARGLDPSSDGNWTGVDLTQVPIFGHVATFNAENLNDNGPGNAAYWFGVPAESPFAEGWATAPGYGNGWRETLMFETAVVDPSLGQTVGLDFYFNLDTERGYDFVSVEFDSAGTWTSIYLESGFSGVPETGEFPVPGLRFAQDTGSRSIVYAGNDYGDDDHIRFRIRFRSDGAYSDEDGLFRSNGAAQIDDVVITTRDGVFTEDFEDFTPGIFTQESQDFFGDFSSVFSDFEDIDPCHENDSPVVGFIDFGQDVTNGPGPDGTTSTGGSTSTVWDYGIPGGYVVNYTGGISDGQLAISNEVWSPAVDWDLLGSDDDDPAMVGAVFSFSVWRHNPIPDGIFYLWHVRAEVGGVWQPWEDRNFIYFSQRPEWLHEVHDVTDLLPAGVERIQMALGVIDFSDVFGFIGANASPAPLFDDVRLRKYRLAGPMLSMREDDLPQDAFPASGEIAVTTAADRDQLDVRFDMARDIGTGAAIVSGDSIVVNATARIPGTELADLRLVWVLRQNPWFEAALRAQPSGPFDTKFESRVDARGVVYWQGEVLADTVKTASGLVLADRFYADLPDEDFLYPGDRLQFYWKATDNEGRVSTLPSDIGGFGVWDTYRFPFFDRQWTMQALPSVDSVLDDIQSPTMDDPRGPDLLIIDEAADASELHAFLTTMKRMRYREGVDFDVYSVRSAEDGRSNGIGAYAGPTPLGDRRGPGAKAAQLELYDAVLFLADDRSQSLLSDGSNTGPNTKSRDIEVLTGFSGLDGRRTVYVFGDNVASALESSSAIPGAAYLQAQMGVDVLGSDASAIFDDATSVQIEALLEFDDFVLSLACPTLGRLDELQPVGAAQSGWRFLDPPNGSPLFGLSAGVIHDRIAGATGDRKIDVTLPFAFSRLDADGFKRLSFLGALWDIPNILPPSISIDAPSGAREPSFAVYPNPFNPTTSLSFALPRVGVHASVVVYDVRGQRVRELFDGVAASADLVLAWDGTDARGARVASGVYLVKAVTEGFRDTQKIALVK